MAKKIVSSSMNVAVDHIADVNPSKLGWNLGVGVVQLFDTPNQWGGPDAYSMDMMNRNKMRCTLFGELVGKVAPLLQNEDVEPLILVTQFFKPNVYLNEGYIQNTLHVSQVFINPDSEDVAAFKRR
ncbi:hypothetical protein PIB30_022176 [Stylosanthes scabra]|uniref:Uncharacterized protein n=1 Tax=Stylosanthes scabra TaxID=79078 RepID=A0ABU6WA27_9FABA|nr:hypothetical protein [Stylosanthes scabra]